MNKSKTVVEEVKARMVKMIQTKRAELEEADKKGRAAKADLAAAENAIKEAAARMDLEAFEAGNKAKHKAETALAMYTEKYRQTQKQEYISEPESDKVIDSLLAYEEQLADKFREAIAEPLEKLKALHDEYMAEVRNTEDTLTAWQRDIHANYSTRGMSSYIDEETGERTDRSKTPVAVHVLPYTGCGEAARLGQYLKNA